MAAPSPSPRPSAPPGEAQEPAEIVYAEDGDVILVLQSGVRLRVSAIILSLVSPVFKTMLGPNFLEGHASRTAEDPREIQLPDDSADGVTLLAQFIHCLPTAPSQTESLANIAKMLTGLGVVADKYDCILAVSMACESIMHRYLARDTLHAYARLAAAAYSLDMESAFAFFTRRLVLDTTASFTEVTDIEGCEILPQSAISE
ncbi:hypothetical protein LTR17_024594 [Elasticomyces elasticus]|nr:hypothetical protein LTR17_024594 [Elasticomyces elasticus]